MTTQQHPTGPQDEVTVTLTRKDVALIRSALRELLQIYTREDHIYHDIHAALAKLPEVAEGEEELAKT